MSVYSGGLYSSGLYGGLELLRTNPGAFVDVYNSAGAFKAGYQIGSSSFLGCEFGFNESGCNNFNLLFGKFVDIEKGDRIKITLFDSIDTFFTGVVRYVAIEGSTKQEYIYSGFGYVDYLEKVNSQILTYNGDTLFDAVEDIIDTFLVPSTPIIKDMGLVDIDLQDITLTDITFNYEDISDVLRKLKNIANSNGSDLYNIGVDNNGHFFFRKRSTDIKVILTVGKFGRYGITDYEPQDNEETVSKLFVLRPNGTFYASYQSLEDIDIKEAKITAPADMNDSDINLWAQGILKEKEKNKRSVSIDWKIEEDSPLLLLCEGYIRIINNIPPTVGDITATGSIYGAGTYGSGLYGGNSYTGYDIDDTLEIKEIKYVINNSIANRTIQLGGIPLEFDRDVNNINRDLQALRSTIGV